MNDSMEYQSCFILPFYRKTTNLEIMQTLILHSIVIKHKAALDQFIKGISILSL